MKEQFTALLSKYESALSDFKRKRRYAYISDENYINYNSHIERLMSMIDIIKSKLVTIESHENDARMRNLIDEYDAIADTNDDLIDSIRRELENSDKSDWYAKNFDNWCELPPRQDCDEYPIIDRLHYSKCRLAMFDHLETTWKKETFPTLAHRLEFF